MSGEVPAGTWLDLRAGLSITIVVTVCVVWDATLVYWWTVGWNRCTPADVVHPQTGMSQTACATVQGHLVHYAEVVFRMYQNGGWGLAGTLPLQQILHLCLSRWMRWYILLPRMQSFPHEPLAIPACLGVDRASFSQLRPCSWWKHRDLPSLLMQNTKAVNLRHLREQFNKRVLLCSTVLTWAKQLWVFLMILCDLLVRSPSTVASSTHCCGQRHQIRGGYRQHWVQCPPQACRNIDRAALEKLFLIVREEAIRAKWRVLEPLSELQQARSATDIKKAPILGMVWANSLQL